MLRKKKLLLNKIIDAYIRAEEHAFQRIYEKSLNDFLLDGCEQWRETKSNLNTFSFLFYFFEWTKSCFAQSIYFFCDLAWFRLDFEYFFEHTEPNRPINFLNGKFDTFKEYFSSSHRWNLITTEIHIFSVHLRAWKIT